MTQFVSLISGKWAIPIIYRLIMLNTPVRFGELLRAAAPITQKELTKQLRLFEQRGLVSRTIFPKFRRVWNIKSRRWGSRFKAHFRRWPRGCRNTAASWSAN